MLDHVQTALALLDTALGAGFGLLRWRLLEARESTLDMQGDRVGQRADIEAAAGRLDVLGQLVRGPRTDDQSREMLAMRRSA